VDSWGTPTAPTYVLASRAARLVAYLINLVAWTLPVVVGYVVAPSSFDEPVEVYDASSGTYVDSNEQAVLVFGGIMLAGWALVLIANVILVATRSQSFGKLCLGIEVVRQDGSRAGFWRIAGLRFLANAAIAMVVPFYSLVDTLFICRTDKRCVHDHLADTVVVVREPGHGYVAAAPRPVEPLTEAVRPVRPCPTCAFDMPSDAVYCSNCGNRIDAVPVGTGADAVPSAAPEQETFQW